MRFEMSLPCEATESPSLLSRNAWPDLEKCHSPPRIAYLVLKSGSMRGFRSRGM
jgi:hypothetical protein